jgi:hypothetical protein
MADNYGMSLVQTCVEAQAAIVRARALFDSPDGVDVPNSATQISGAIQTATAAREGTTDMAGGAGMPAYRELVDRSVPPLRTASSSDTGLSTQVGTAAAVSAAGAARLDAITAQTHSITQAAAAARSAGAQRAVLSALRSQLAQAQQVVASTRQQAGASAAAISALRYPEGAPDGGGSIQPLDDGAGKSPPHGHDPRYWIDVTKIVQVPDGALAPRGYVQIGPNQWYPFEDNQMSVHPPPDPVKYPLDLNTISHVAPGQLGPTGTTELSPGVFAPDPRKGPGPQPPWPAPQAPVDIRDVIHVPPNELAPWGYREYLPGWWAPDVSRDSGPHLPPRR